LPEIIPLLIPTTFRTGPHGQTQTTNLAFGGPDWKTLYFTNWNFLGSVNLRIAGMPVPAVKKA
jgi:sugar lactone lactonase YvrE